MNKSILILGLMLLGLAGMVTADVQIDDFEVNLADDDIDVGDDFELELIFTNPDINDTITAEIEVEIDGFTVYLNEDYSLTFISGEDLTETISSNNFPGPEGDHDYWNDHWMNYECGEFDIDVMISSNDLGDYDDSETLQIGDGDEQLSYVMEPTTPSVNTDVTIEVRDEDDDELRSAEVKVTWIDDEGGDEDDEWDSDDEEWHDRTDNDGQVEFNIADDFDDDVTGKFEIAVFKNGYCKESEIIEITNKLLTEINPEDPTEGKPFEVCVKDEGGDGIYYAEIYVYGMGYSQTYYTFSTGCKKITLSNPGKYYMSVTKQGYDDVQDLQIDVGQDIVTTTTTTTQRALTTTTRRQTTTTSLLRVLSVTSSQQCFTAGETAFIKVRDDNEIPVGGADIEVRPAGIRGTTDNYGSYSFTVNNAGAYTVIAEKQGYVKDSEGIQYNRGSTTATTLAGDSGSEDTTSDGETSEKQGIIARIKAALKRMFRR